MVIQSVWQKSLEFFGKPVVVQPGEVKLTSDAGLLPIREFDQRIGLTEQFEATGEPQREFCTTNIKHR